MPPDIVFRPALYVGSIPFEADKLSRAAFVRNKLEGLQSFSFFKPVVLCISTSGVKVCDPECRTVYMAHALRRISYATCDPYSSKFAFLAREANSETPCQYCHIFATDTQCQAEELNAIIGDAFKLAYAKQRLPQQTCADTQLPALSSLHPANLLNPPPREKATEGSTPPLHIPPPPPTSPPPPLPSTASPPPILQESKTDGGKLTSETQCNGGKPSQKLSGLRRQWLEDEEEEEAEAEAEAEEEGEAEGESERKAVAKEGDRDHENVAPHERAFSDSRAPCPHLLRQRNQKQQPPSRHHPPSARHSVAFFDTPSPATPRLFTPQAPPPPTQTSSPSLPTTPVFAKDKHRAIFDLPLGDYPLSTTAVSPVVALKTHLDSLANESKKVVKQPPHHKKSESPFPSSGNGVVSRFRLRQSGSGGGSKKRQLERPLSQIICQLDSAMLLNNSPSFSVQLRSEERLNAPEPFYNSHSIVAEERGDNTESDDVMGIPRAVVKCLNDLENPPIPPVRVNSLRRSCGEILRQSSSDASPCGSRGRRPPPQHRSGFSGMEMAEIDMRKSEEAGADITQGTESQEEDDAEALEFAILEAAAAAEVEAEESLAAAMSQRNLQLADVCSVPLLSDPGVAWQPKADASSGGGDGEIAGACPLHAGLESSPSPLHNGRCKTNEGGKHLFESQTGNNAGWLGGLNSCRPTPTTPLKQSHHQSSRWTGETPTPTATPTPTPTPAPLMPSQHHPPPWFQAYLPREVALELLTHEETGSFLVRDSVTQPGCWALSVRVPTHVNCVGITHYLIQHSKHGVKLKGLDKEWPSLEALITHLTVMPEMLPCPLRLPPTAYSANTGGNHHDHHQASNPTFIEDEEGEGTGPTVVWAEDEDEEYQRLSDFSSMLADMQPASTVSHLFR